MNWKNYKLELGQKRTYTNGYTKTFYLDSKVLNVTTGKTIKGLCIESPIRTEENLLRLDSLNWCE